MNKSLFNGMCDKSIGPLSILVMKDCYTLDWEVCLVGDWKFYQKCTLYVLPPKAMPYTNDHPWIERARKKYQKWLDARTQTGAKSGEENG
jgi:hypothetical protein